MTQIIIYQKPTCSTCRKVIKLVRDSRKPFIAINYYEKPLTKSRLKELLKKGRLKAKEVMRTKEDIYKSLGLAKTEKPEDELIELIIKHPDLLQRPLVEKGKTVIMARPPETIEEILYIKTKKAFQQFKEIKREKKGARRPLLKRLV